MIHAKPISRGGSALSSAVPGIPLLLPPPSGASGVISRVYGIGVPGEGGLRVWGIASCDTNKPPTGVHRPGALRTERNTGHPYGIACFWGNPHGV